jgi:flagellar basal-body rod protein FlgC
MSAAAEKLAVAAHNTANINTDGFEAQRVVVDEVSSGGVKVNTIPIEKEPPVILRDGALVEPSNADIVTETIYRIEAIAAYKANAAVLRTVMETEESVINIFA